MYMGIFELSFQLLHMLTILRESFSWSCRIPFYPPKIYLIWTMTILFKQRFLNYTWNKPEMGKIAFVWVPRHVDIRENSAADSAVKDDLNDDTADELTPFSNLKPPLNK